MNDQQRAAMQMALEWFDWCLDDKPAPTISARGVAAALREALAQPQGEPVAWMHIFMGVAQINTTPPEIYGKDWTHQPLYTTTPSVEAAIEATKEKAAKVCAELVVPWDENTPNGELIAIRNSGMVDCAAAIRSMK
jgi:hypothetical protein